MLRRCSAAALLVVFLSPASALAWGFEAHKTIMRRAIDILPPPLKQYFGEHRDQMIAQTIEPDLWRAFREDEDSNHFVNFGDPELGPFPFTGYPREYGAALEKFGETRLNRLGRLPFREQEMFGNLVRAFQQTGKGSVVRREESFLFAAVAAHYLQDSTQPLHASNNFNGQLTDQLGVHTRFEADLFERFGAKLTLAPAPPRTFSSVKDVAFETLLASHQKVDALLEADKEATGRKDTYDDEYYEAFFARVKPMMEERLSTAISLTASMIVSAWEQAGRPDLHPTITPGLRKVQRSR